MSLVLREPRVASTLQLGQAVISNPTALRRRVMMTTMVPLAEADNVQSSDPFTVLQPGTGRNELAQVEYNWLCPYPNSQKVARVTYPCVINGSDNDMRVSITRSAAGLGNMFHLRGNVQAGIEAMGIRFFCGPSATHYVDLKLPNTQLPSPTITGTKARVYVWQGRIYEPSHAPSLRTQAHGRVEIELFDDEDYGEIRTEWVIADPRVDEPDGMERSAWSDADTAVGFEFIIPNQNQAQPVPWSPEQCVVSLQYQTDRWRWVQDGRYVVNSVTLNDVLPWGIRGYAEGVMLFRGTSGDLGDQLRNDSCQAWIDVPDPVYSLSDQWLAKPDALLLGHLPRPFKRHEHFDQNRDFAYVRDRLRTQVRSLSRSGPTGGRAYLWDRGPAACNLYQTQYGVDSTGMDDGWVKTPHWEAIAYLVPDVGALARRYLHAVGSPCMQLAADGSLITGITHPNMQIEVGSPGQRLGNGDLLGKTRLQAWRQNPNSWLLRSPASGTPVINGKDRAHYENQAPYAHVAYFGSRGMRRLCEVLAYTRVMGEWSAASWNTGVTDQPRGLARGIANHGFASWLFGADSAWETQINALKSVRIDPAHASVERDYGLLPRDQRRLKTCTIQRRGSYSGPTRVDLELHEYGRWWEEVFAMIGLVAMEKHVARRHSSLSWVATMRREYEQTHLHSMPRGIDADGRVLWTVLRPADNNQPLTIYEPVAAAAILAPGTAALTEQHFQMNNWSICNNQSGGQCSTANTGFARMGTPGASTSGFVAQANAWLYNGRGGVTNPRDVRYCYDLHTGRSGNPSNITLDVFLWLTRFGITGAFAEWLHVPTNVTTRANIGFTPSGVAMLSDGRLVVTRPGTTSVSIVDRGSGVVQTLQPQTAVNWSGVVAHGTKVVLLDGYDPSLNRVTRVLYPTTEQIVGAMTPLAWVLDTIEGRDFRGIAYDPYHDAYLSCGYRLGRTTIWRIPLTGGPSAIDTTISPHEDFDTQPQSIAVSQDGKLLAIGRTDGTVWLHTRAQGGYWSHPRLRVQRGGWVTFTRHNREDDALRLVSISEAGQIVESEV